MLRQHPATSSPTIALVLLLAALATGQESRPVEGPSLAAAVRDYLEADDGNAGDLAKAIAARPDADFASSMKAIEEVFSDRPAADPGRREFTLDVPSTGESFRVLVQVPRGYTPERLWPLWVGMHSAGGVADEPFAVFGELVDSEGFILISLEEARSRRQGGWGFTEAEREAHRLLIRHALRDHRIDTDRIYLSGYSRGGHGSWDLGIRYPDIFAGIIPISGSVPQRELAMVDNLFGPRVQAFIGSKDQRELVEGARAAAARMKTHDYDIRFVEDPERGHEHFADAAPTYVKAALERRRDPWPERFLFRTWYQVPQRCGGVVVSEISSKCYEPGRQIVIPGSSKMTQEKRLSAYLDAIDRTTARVEWRRRNSNEWKVDTKLVERMTIRIPADGPDFSRKIVVNLNGRKVLDKKIEPSVLALLESVRESFDPRLAVAFAITLKP